MQQVIVTRHTTLVQHLIETGVVGQDVQVIAHVSSPEQIAGKHVIGVLPIHLAALAAKVTVLGLNIPEQFRGVELTPEQVREFAEKSLKTFVVKEV